MASKKIENRLVMLRIPPSLYDKLLKVSTNRSLKEGRRISVPRIILEAVESSVN